MKWSWLQNPAVTLIGLLASVIAVVQCVASICRYIYRLQKEAENEQYRRIRIAVAALIVVAAFSAFTWPVLIGDAAKAGDRGFMGVLDVLEFAFLGLYAAQTLLKEARTRHRFSMLACALLFITLATVATGYIFSSGSTAWIGTSITPSSTDLAIVALTYLFFQHARKIKPKNTNAQRADMTSTAS